MTDPDATATVALRLRNALEESDLSAFAELLDNDVRWGPPDSTSPPCSNKQQVLAWYRRGAAAGANAHVTEMVVERDRILVGLAIEGMKTTPQRNDVVSRWQVFTLRDGLIVDIVGYDSRGEAADRVGIAD
jgi:hypothetical protein